MWRSRKGGRRAEPHPESGGSPGTRAGVTSPGRELRGPSEPWTRALCGRQSDSRLIRSHPQNAGSGGSLPAPPTVRRSLPALGRGPETHRHSRGSVWSPLRLRVGMGARRSVRSGAGAWDLSRRGFRPVAATRGPSPVRLPLVTVPLRTERQPPGLTHTSPDPRSGTSRPGSSVGRGPRAARRPGRGSRRPAGSAVRSIGGPWVTGFWGDCKPEPQDGFSPSHISRICK